MLQINGAEGLSGMDNRTANYLNECGRDNDSARNNRADVLAWRAEHTLCSGDFLSVSLGMGADSIALLVGLQQRGITPDKIIFADVGDEKPYTMGTVLLAVSTWCDSVGFPPITIVRKLELGEHYTLEAHCLKTGTMPSLRTFGRSCSQKFKHELIEAHHAEDPRIKAIWAAGGHILSAIGYEAGEQYRAAGSPQTKVTTFKRGNAKRGFARSEYRYWYPLIEWAWTRSRCVDEILNAGLPHPGKSACFYCPASKAPEIEWLAQAEPNQVIRAFEMELKTADYSPYILGLGLSLKGDYADLSWFEYLDLKVQAGLVVSPEVSAYLDAHRAEFAMWRSRKTVSAERKAASKRALECVASANKWNKLGNSAKVVAWKTKLEQAVTRLKAALVVEDAMVKSQDLGRSAVKIAEDLEVAGITRKKGE